MGGRLQCFLCKSVPYKDTWSSESRQMFGQMFLQMCQWRKHKLKVSNHSARFIWACSAWWHCYIKHRPPTSKHSCKLVISSLFKSSHLFVLLVRVAARPLMSHFIPMNVLWHLSFQSTNITFNMTNRKSRWYYWTKSVFLEVISLQKCSWMSPTELYEALCSRGWRRDLA